MTAFNATATTTILFPCQQCPWCSWNSQEEWALVFAHPLVRPSPQEARLRVHLIVAGLALYCTCWRGYCLASVLLTILTTAVLTPYHRQWEDSVVCSAGYCGTYHLNIGQWKSLRQIYHIVHLKRRQLPLNWKLTSQDSAQRRGRQPSVLTCPYIHGGM